MAGIAAPVKIIEDKPLADPPRHGKITGVIKPSAKIESISAVNLVSEKPYKPASFNKKTGEFAFEDLPGDARYDIRITINGGRRIEGVNLDFTDARLLRLAETRREQLDLPPPRKHKFTRHDAKAIIEHIENMEDFMDLHRPLYVKGHGKRATVLLEMMRTRPFHQSGEDIIWRVELWYFRHEHGGWVLMDNQNRMLTRLQAPPRQWRKVNVQYYPQLSVYVNRDGEAEPVSFTIPEKPDPSRGRAPNTPPKLTTEPHILGLGNKNSTGRGEKDN